MNSIFNALNEQIVKLIDKCIAGKISISYVSFPMRYEETHSHFPLSRSCAPVLKNRFVL